MAKVTSGSFNTSKYTDPDGDYKYLTFSWTATQSVEKNESTINWTLKGVGNSGYLMSGPFTVIIDGATVYSSSTRIELRNGTLVASGSKKLSHSDAGAKSFSASVSAAIYTYAVSSTGSGSWDLKDIPRASEPTVSASSVTMGNALTITTNRKSTSFTHTLSYKFGTASGTIATGVGASYAWTVPDLASYCNNATSGTCTITCITYNGSSKVGEKTVNVTLNVPGASVPTVSPATVVMGNILTISTNRKSSNFKHKLSYSFNGATGTLDTDATTSFSWTVPLDLAKQIKDKPSGDGTITCVTYNGTAVVGTAQTVSFKASVPNNSTTQPSVSNFALTPYGTVPSAFSGLYIQTKTGIKATFTATSTYSTISSYKMTIGSITIEGNPATLTSFSTAGDKTVIGTVTDARGYSTSVTKSVTVIPYGIPKVVSYSGEKAVICERCTNDGTLNDAGTYLRIKVGRDYSKVMVGETQKNFCRLGYRYKVSSANSYSSDVVLIETDGTHKHPSGTFVVSTSNNNDEINVAIPNIVVSPTTSYDVQIFVSDTMGETDTFTVRVPTAGTDFHLREGGKGAAFGKYSEIEGGVEFEWDVYGRAYGLGKLIQIPKNADLNDEKYLVFGCYGIATSETAESISNIPYQYAGILRVYSAIGNGLTVADEGWVYIAQEYETYYGTGRFRRLAHRDGTDAEWTFDPWRAIGGTDSIISNGTITTSTGVNWHYKKWFNGTAECWARRSVTLDTTGQWGSLFSGGISSTPLPFTFIEAPICNVTVEKGTTDHFFFVGSNGQATTTATQSILIFRPASSTGVNVNVLYSVYGKWK